MIKDKAIYSNDPDDKHSCKHDDDTVLNAVFLNQVENIVFQRQFHQSEHSSVIKFMH